MSDPVGQHNVIVAHLIMNLQALGFTIESVLQALPPGLRNLPHRYSGITLSQDMFIQVGKDKHNAAVMEIIVHFLLNLVNWDQVVTQNMRAKADAGSMRAEEIHLHSRKLRDIVQEEFTNLNVVFPCLERHHVTSFKQHAKFLLEVIQGTPSLPQRVNVEAALTEAKFRCAQFLLQLSVAVMHSQLGFEYVQFTESAPLCVLEALRAKQVAILKERACAYVEVGKRLKASQQHIKEVASKVVVPLAMPSSGSPQESEAQGIEHLSLETRMKWMSLFSRLHNTSKDMDDALRDSKIDAADIFPNSSGPVPLTSTLWDLSKQMKESSVTRTVGPSQLENIVRSAVDIRQSIEICLDDHRSRLKALQTLINE